MVPVRKSAWMDVHAVGNTVFLCCSRFTIEWYLTRVGFRCETEIEIQRSLLAPFLSVGIIVWFYTGISLVTFQSLGRNGCRVQSIMLDDGGN